MSRVLHRAGGAPPVAVGGEGIRLRLADGRTIIDASGGAAVSCLGHGHPLARQASRQPGALAYAHTGFFTTEPPSVWPTADRWTAPRAG